MCDLDPDCALAPNHVERWCMTANQQHTPKQREQKLAQMRYAIDSFYSFAQVTEVHTFLEFAGFMSEYVKQCAKMHELGKDFVTEPIELCESPEHAAAYIGEKLNCVYGPTLREPANLRAFLAALGVELQPVQP